MKKQSKKEIKKIIEKVTDLIVENHLHCYIDNFRRRVILYTHGKKGRCLLIDYNTNYSMVIKRAEIFHGTLKVTCYDYNNNLLIAFVEFVKKVKINEKLEIEEWAKWAKNDNS